VKFAARDIALLHNTTVHIYCHCVSKLANYHPT